MTQEAKAAQAGTMVASIAGVLCFAALALTAGAQVPESPDRWVEALAEARSVQRIMAYAIVALALCLGAVSGYVVKLLATVVREATAEMRLCRERHEGRERR